MQEIPFLVSDNWDAQLAGYTYAEMRDHCLFGVIWSERPKGGYNASDWHPFVAMKKVINQGIEAYEGISLGMTFDIYQEIGKNFSKERRIRKVGVHAREYRPISFMEDTGRMTIVSNPDELLELFLNRWKTQDYATNH